MSTPSTPAVTDFTQYGTVRAAANRNDPKALHYAAQQFEALMTEMMLKSAHATQFGDDMLGDQGGFYQDMFDQQMAMHLASGKGLGIADMLVRQLSGGAAGKASASAVANAYGAAQGAAAAGNAATPASASTSDSDILSKIATTLKAATAALHSDSAAAQTGDAADASPATDSAARAGGLTGAIRDFVSAVLPHAQKAAAALGVPARALIAQAALETGWGQHLPQQADGSGFNLFGIKAGGNWNGSSASHDTSEFVDGAWTQQSAKFRTYSSLSQSFDDYVQFLKSNPRYADALRSGDINGFAQGLQKAGYATDPQYAQKIIRIANSAELNGALAANTSLNA